MEQMAIEFCQVPRTLGEIKDHVGLAGYDIVRIRVVQPLIDQGKLKLTHPHDPLYKLQKYVVTESSEGFESFVEDNIIEYCATPRTAEEVKKHFGIKQDLFYKVIRPLIAEGKLIYTKPIKVGNKIIHKKLVKNNFPQTPIIERTKPTENDIIKILPRAEIRVRDNERVRNQRLYRTTNDKQTHSRGQADTHGFRRKPQTQETKSGIKGNQWTTYSQTCIIKTARLRKKCVQRPWTVLSVNNIF